MFETRFEKLLNIESCKTWKLSNVESSTCCLLTDVKDVHIVHTLILNGTKEAKEQVIYSEKKFEFASSILADRIF